jgi:hypothetical protein
MISHIIEEETMQGWLFLGEAILFDAVVLFP